MMVRIQNHADSIDKTSMRIRTVALWVTAANAFATFVVMVVAFVTTIFVGPTAARIVPGLLLTLVLIAWTQSAYWLLMRLLRRERSRIRSRITSIGSLIIVGWSAIVLVDAFLIRPDPQSPLILLFLPFLQWIGCIIVLLADAVVARFELHQEARPHVWNLKTRLKMILLAVAVTFAGWWLIQRPSNEREWEPDLATLPLCKFDGNTVSIQNVRNTEYRSAEDYTTAYDDRTFDLRRIQSADFIVVPFQSVNAAAHTFVIFGFEDGGRVAISVEVRRERGESYSPFRGLLRQCELMYVVADERDVILLRTKYRNDRVYLYPIRASREKIRDMFVSMLRRANQLRDQPEFYNSLTNNCSSNILKHFNHVNERKLPANLKVLFPGYSDRLIYDLGLIDSQLPFDKLKHQSEITEKANRFANDVEFSQLIRK